MIPFKFNLLLWISELWRIHVLCYLLEKHVMYDFGLDDDHLYACEYCGYGLPTYPTE